jgi:outer membrane lipoprotein-sorting protein
MVSLRSNLAVGRLAAAFFLSLDASAVLDAWFAAQKDLHSWAADFVQTRSLKTLTQPLTAAGRLLFEAPNDFRWELGRPAQTIALRNGADLYVIYPALKRAEHYSLGAAAPAQWRDSMSLLNAGFPRNRQEFESQFKVVSVAQSNGLWQLALEPKSKFARQMMPELRIGLTTNNFSLASTELVFVDGSSMRNDFTNAVVNPALDKSVFGWTPPPDYKITEPLSK